MEPREAMDICLRVLKESKKSRFDSCSVRNSILIKSHITFRDCRVHIFPTTFLEIAVYIQAYWKLIKTISTHACNQWYSPQEQIIYNGRHALKAKLQTTELNLRQFTILVLGTQSKGRSTGVPNSIICERMLKIITSANT